MTTDIPQELAQRMATLLRDCVGKVKGENYVTSAVREARAIVALLPEPVDPDIQVLTDIAKPYDWNGFSEGRPIYNFGMKCLKRGRELEREERNG